MKDLDIFELFIDEEAEMGGIEGRVCKKSL